MKNVAPVAQHGDLLRRPPGRLHRPDELQHDRRRRRRPPRSGRRHRHRRPLDRCHGSRRWRRRWLGPEAKKIARARHRPGPLRFEHRQMHVGRGGARRRHPRRSRRACCSVRRRGRPERRSGPRAIGCRRQCHRYRSEQELVAALRFHWPPGGNTSTTPA